MLLTKPLGTLPKGLRTANVGITVYDFLGKSNFYQASKFTKDHSASVTVSVPYWNGLAKTDTMV